VPAGLSLLIGAETLRSQLTERARSALIIAGLGLLYGSVGVQVFQVERPVHALVLFGTGLTAVGVGLARQRNDYLVMGTLAIVLDVLGYLLRNGFERDFIGAGLLVGSGLTLLCVATILTRRRRAKHAEGPTI